MPARLDKSLLEALGYKVNDRMLKDLRPLFSADYHNAKIPAGYDWSVAYSGAEHSGKTWHTKLPNLTVLPNLSDKYANIILGQTFGHQHTQGESGDHRIFQEIYEFVTHGAMLLRNKVGTTLHLLRPGEKVAVKPDENMTLINLGHEPLVTRDYANPGMNSATKDLEERIGPLLFAQASNEGVAIIPNEKYHQEGLVTAKPTVCSIHMNDVKPGRELFERIWEDRRKFDKNGIQVSYGTNLPKELEKEFSKPLLELVLSHNSFLFDILDMIKEPRPLTPEGPRIQSADIMRVYPDTIFDESGFGSGMG